VIMQG